MNTSTTPISSNKVKNAWATYDLANSVYNLVITATIFPIYYKSVTEITNEKKEVISNTVNFLGFNFKNTALYDFAIATAYLLTVFLVPLLSGLADGSGNKKKYMQLFCYIGATSCLAMYFFDAQHVTLGIFLAITACMGYSGSLVFYNAYLPEIATPAEQDGLSAKGFAMGYAGSAFLLIVNLIMIKKFYLFGFSGEREATRMAFITVGVWWFLFSLIPFKYLPNNKKENAVRVKLSQGYSQLIKVWHEIKTQNELLKFLSAFFVYSMGVQTVMLIATHFASEEIGMESAQLITTILIIQFVALIGAYVFSYVSKIKGNLFMLRVAVCIWALICIITFQFIHTVTAFYFVAAVVGLVMGGIQSLSRSTYSKMLPDVEEHSSYFSFYDVAEKMSIVLGMVTFGVITQLSSNMRTPILSLIVFFVVGLALLFRLNGSLLKSKGEVA
ncbi:MAG: MFS transporter [Bacteroidia bacterium]